MTRYQKGWALTCEALLKLLINPPDVAAAQANAAAADASVVVGEQDLDDQGFSVGFTQLATCRNAPVDPYPEVVDVKSWLGEYLKLANDRHRGRISGFVTERLSDEARGALDGLMG